MVVGVVAGVMVVDLLMGLLIETYF